MGELKFNIQIIPSLGLVLAVLVELTEQAILNVIFAMSVFRPWFHLANDKLSKIILNIDYDTLIFQPN